MAIIGVDLYHLVLARLEVQFAEASGGFETVD